MTERLSKSEAFLKVAEYCKHNDDEQGKINDLIKNIIVYTTCEPHSFPYMMSEIKKHFGKLIIIAEQNRNFHLTASTILHEVHYQTKPPKSEEK